MADSAGAPTGNSAHHTRLHAPALAPPAHSHLQRHLPPGASYAHPHPPPPAPSPTPTRPLHRLDTAPTLSLSIGNRSPLVTSSEWPSASTPSPSPSADPSFTGIPAGRLHPPSSPSPRQTQSAHFPSFNLPPNLSPNDALRDRGPYPPHARSQSTGTLLTSPTYAPGGAAPGAPWEEAELLVDRNPSARADATTLHPTSSSPLSFARSPRSPSPSPALERPLSIADQVVGTPPPPSSFPPPIEASASASTNPRGSSYYLDDLTTPVSASDMAGVGRNSIIRSVGATSPVATFRTSLGPQGAPSPNLDPNRASFIVQPQQPGRTNSTVQIAPSGGPTQQQGPTTQTTAAAGSAANLPPHLVAQPEICVECMMRDRDMADVDVTTEGIWERDSDRDWHEQLKWERDLDDGREDDEEQVRADAAAAGGGGGIGSGGNGSAASQESGTGTGERRRGSTTNASHHSRDSNGARLVGKRRRLGRGQALTSGNLKVWTAMNPPAAAHRWRTLQNFLATQIHLLELDRQARARESAQLSSQHSHAPSQNRSSRSSTYQMPISTTPEPIEGGRARAKSGGSRGYLADETNRKSTASSLFPPPAPHQPQQQIAVHSQSYPQPGPSGSSPYPTHPQYMHPSLASSGVSIQSYSYGDQPWLSSQSARRASSSRDASPPTSTKSPAPSMKFSLPKFARSTTDLRSISTPRSLSPARNSLNVDDRDYGGGGRRSSTSLWSKFRNSTSNQSVMSFNPSASMMDMHLGLSQDKHGAFGAGGAGAYRNSGYASSTIAIGQRGYSYYQPQSPATPYDTYPGGDGGMRGLNMSDPAVARHAELRERDRALAANQARGADETVATKDKKKKKGIKGFFSKLVGGGGGTNDRAATPQREQSLSRSAPATPASEVPCRGNLNFDDDVLAPPPPLSALANEPRYHQRSSSTSSVDSFTGPYTPPLQPATFRSSYAMPLPSASNPNISNVGDRQSILTTGSYSSARSKPAHPQQPSINGRLQGSRDSVNRPSFDSLHDSLAVPRLSNSPEIQARRDDRAGSAEVLAGGGDDVEEPRTGAYPTYSASQQPRTQKSLPSLPTELGQSQARPSNPPAHPDAPPGPLPGQFYPNYHEAGASRSAYSLVQFPSRPLSPPDSADERDRYSTVGSRASTANARKTRSTVFSFFGRKKSGEELDHPVHLAAGRVDANDRSRSFDLVSRY
ncbi:hypothetical protein JCM11491_005967 [Sporobolomyces phaffii]